MREPQLDVVGDALAAMLETDSHLRISLEVHTYDSDSAEYNVELSEQRVKTVRSYLIDTVDFPEDSIDTFGAGDPRFQTNY